MFSSLLLGNMLESSEPMFEYDAAVTLPANSADRITDAQNVLANLAMNGVWQLFEGTDFGTHAGTASTSSEQYKVYIKFLGPYSRPLIVKQHEKHSHAHVIIIAQPEWENHDSFKGELYVKSAELKFSAQQTVNDMKRMLILDKGLLREHVVYDEKGPVLDPFARLHHGFYVIYLYGRFVRLEEFGLKFQFKLLNEHSAKAFVGALFLDFMPLLPALTADLDTCEDHLILRAVQVRRVLRKYDRAVDLFKRFGAEWLQLNDLFVEKLAEADSSQLVLQKALHHLEESLPSLEVLSYYTGPSVDHLYNQLDVEELKKILKSLQDTLAAFKRTNLDEIGVYQVLGWINRLKVSRFLKIANVDDNLRIKVRSDRELVQRWVADELCRCTALNRLDLVLFEQVQKQIHLLQGLNQTTLELVESGGAHADHLHLFDATSRAVSEASTLLELVRDEKPENWHSLQDEAGLAEKCLLILHNVLPLMEAVHNYEERKQQLQRLIDTKLRYTKEWSRREKQNLVRLYDDFKHADEELVYHQNAAIRQLNQLNGEDREELDLDRRIPELGMRISKCIEAKTPGRFSRVREFLHERCNRIKQWMQLR